MSRVGDPIALLVMVHNEKHAQMVSNVLQYAASQRANNSSKGKMMGAPGDRNNEGQNPPFVRLKPFYFEWRKMRLPTDRKDSGPMATFYDTPDNEGDFCNLEGGELEINKMLMPKFALVSSEIAADALEEG